MNRATKENLARLGIVSRGVIFLIMGIITLRAALGSPEGKAADSLKALSYLETQWYGVPLLLLIALGLLIYIIWRVYLGIKEEGDSKSDTLRIKANHYGIALVYVFFLAFTLKLIFDIETGGNYAYKSFIIKMSNKWWGEVIIFLSGLGVVGKGIFQFYLAFSRKFWILVDKERFSKIATIAYNWTGVIGYVIRGFIFSILGGLIIRSAFVYWSNPAKGVEEALHFIENIAGDPALFTIAFGLILFSFFVFIKAYYRTVEIDD